MLKEQLDFRYQTEKINITTSVLQSMVHNLGKKINKMRVKIQFADQKGKKDFEKSQQKWKQREDVIDLDSGSEIQSEEEQKSEVQSQLSTPSKITSTANDRGNIDKRSIPVSFEMSCLLKEHYMEQLLKIGRRLNVRFMVVPNKVKIMGYKSDLVDQAEEQFGYIQDRIRFTPIPEAGRQIYQSKLYRQILKQHKIKVVKILTKYYFWYEDDVKNPSEILTYVCNKTKHKMISFHKLKYTHQSLLDEFREPVQIPSIIHGQLRHKQFRTSITYDLISQVKAKIYEDYICNEINRLEKNQDRKIELSEDRTNLILHLDAVQQINIRQETIIEYFEPFKYTYFLFDEGTNMLEVNRFLNTYMSKGNTGFKKAKKDTKSLFFFHIIGNFVCLAYLPKQNDSQTSNVDQIMSVFKAMPEQLLTFQLAVRCYLDDPEQEPQFKKFAFEKDKIEKVTYIRCKNPSYKNYELLIQCYIDEKFNQAKKNKQAQLNNAKEEVSVSISVDVSRPIDQTSMMLNDTLNISNNNISRNDNETSMMKVLPPELGNINQPVFRFENYTFCINEKPEEKAKRYSGTLDKVKRKEISYANAEMQKALIQQTKSKFKIYKITIPSKYNFDLQASVKKAIEKQPDLERFNRYVTVFYGGKQAKDYQKLYNEDTPLKVLRLIDQNNNNMRQGYFLRTNIIFAYLKFQEKTYVELPFGHYEAQYFVKRLQ